MNQTYGRNLYGPKTARRAELANPQSQPPLAGYPSCHAMEFAG
jgi:hypothetical protein